MKNKTVFHILVASIVFFLLGLFVSKFLPLPFDHIQKNGNITTYTFLGVVRFEMDKFVGITDMRIYQEGSFYTNIPIGKAKFYFNGKEFSLEDSLKIKEVNLKYSEVSVEIYTPFKSQFGEIQQIFIKRN